MPQFFRDNETQLVYKKKKGIYQEHTKENYERVCGDLLQVASGRGPEGSGMQAAEVAAILNRRPAVENMFCTSRRATEHFFRTMELQPSKLGTREYWDGFYNLEKKNFAENNDDTGECWFSDSGAEEKMVDYLVGLGEEARIDDANATVVDLGTGNGRLLFSLREAGYEGAFTGLDYSLPAVDFATKVAEAEGIENVVFKQADFLANDDWNPDNAQWDVVLDKGTLDAIALSGLQFEGQSAVQRYVSKVAPMIKREGLLLITSCNFTEKELMETFTSAGLKVQDVVPYPKFKFGGVEGQTICTIAFTN